MAGWRFGLGALVLVALFSRLAYLGLLGRLSYLAAVLRIACSPWIHPLR